MALYLIHNIQGKIRYPKWRAVGGNDYEVVHKLWQQFLRDLQIQSSLSQGRNWNYNLLNKICKFVTWFVYYSKMYLRKNSQRITSLQTTVVVGWCLPFCETLRIAVVSYRRFWAAYWSYFQGLRRSTNYRQTARDNPEE